MENKSIEALQKISIYDLLVSWLFGLLYLDKHEKEKEKLLEMVDKKLNIDIDIETDDERKGILSIVIAFLLTFESEGYDVDLNNLENLKEALLIDVGKADKLMKECLDNL